MPLALRRYLICAGAASLAMALYALLITPWLQTPPKDSLQPTRAVATVQTDNWWSDLFPPDAWQNQRPMVIQTEQGTLLFKALKTLDSGEKVNLSPLTLIVPMSTPRRDSTAVPNRASAQVYRAASLAIVEAPEGANIEFRESPDWTSGTMPPVVRGMLVGSISLTGIRPSVESHSTQSRTEWLIRTANVRIEGKRVWTNNDVELLFGNNRALGSDLSITLKRDLMSSEGAGGDGQFSLLKAMELRSVREVTARLEEGGGLWKGLPLGRPEVEAAHAQVPATLTLLCKGALQLDFDHSLASLSDHIHIQHRFDNEVDSDQFLCHELTAKFSFIDDKVANSSDDTFSSAKLNQSIRLGPMQIDSIDALGIDTVGPRPAQNTVQLIAPNIATQLLAKRLKIDFSEKFHAILIDSRNGRSSEGARTGLAHITLDYLGNVLRTPELRYGLVPTNQNLSWLSAAGPGDLQSAGDSALGVAAARWSRVLVMGPEKLKADENATGQSLSAETITSTTPTAQSIATTTDPNRPLDQQFSADVHRIVLDGNAELDASERGQLRGQQIVMTLRSIASAASVVSPSADPGAVASTAAMPRSTRLEKLDAYAVSPTAPAPAGNSHVVLGNPTQRIEVQSLHFRFIYPESTTSPTKERLELSDAIGRPMHQWVSPPTAVATAAAGASPPTTQPNSTLAPQNVANSSLTSGSTATAANLPPLGLPLQLSAPGMTSPDARSHSGAAGHLASLPGPASGPMRVMVVGKQLHSQIIMASPKPWMDQLIVTGPVVVSPDGPGPAAELNWNVSGSELMLNGGADEHYELQVVGKSTAQARLSFGDGWIEGPVVRLSQRTGHLWIDKPGTLCVPASLISQAHSPGVGSKSQGLLNQSGIQWIEPIKCRWKGGMLFNGLTATIRGDIDFDGYARTGPDRLLFLHGKCDSVEVRLTEGVNLGNPGKTNATIHSITLRDNVDIRTAQKDLQGVRLSLEEIILPELTFEVGTNTVVGRGPGQIHSQHQAASGGLSSGIGNGLGQMTSASSNSASVPGASRFQGLHLMFRDFLEMKLSEKQLAFQGRVEVGIGPIASLEQSLDLGSMRVLQPEQSLLRGDRLNIYDASDVTRQPTASLAEGAWEMAALGNVSFETSSEHGELVGKASRLTYVQAKDLLVIGGDPRVPAEIRHRPKSSAQYALAILSLWQGSINTRDFRPSGELQMAGNTQIIPRTTPIADNWKTGTINPASTESNASGVAPTPTPSRPRDSLNDWFKPTGQ